MTRVPFKPMKVLTPIAVTAAMLTSSTIAETEHLAWSNATTYAVGARVIADHQVWESVAAGNVNHNPETDSTSAWWVLVGPTNRHAMFDGSVLTASTASTDIEVVLTPMTIVEGVAVIAGIGARVRVRMHDEDGVLRYDQTKRLSGTAIRSWRDWFFARRVLAGELMFEGLPRYYRGVITVTIYAAAGKASIGALVLGRLDEVGETLAPTTLGGADFFTIDTNTFGTTRFVNGPRVRRTQQRVLVAGDQVARVDYLLSQMSASPAVWIGVSDATGTSFSVLIVFGIRRDYSFELQDDGDSVLNLEIIGIANATAAAA